MSVDTAAWREMDSRTALRVWGNYAGTTEVLRARMAGRLQCSSVMAPGDFPILLTLAEADGHFLRSSQLACLIEWDRSRLSHYLSRMERRGLIARRSCSEDGRGAVIQLTEAGMNAFTCGSVPLLQAVRELFVDAFSAEQLDQLNELIMVLRRHLGLCDEQLDSCGGEAACCADPQDCCGAAPPCSCTDDT